MQEETAVNGDATSYQGYRKLDGSAAVRRARKGRYYRLNPRFDLRNHSPTGFEWGYEGSGPAQLALAILCDVLHDDERACRLYQTFKRRVIAPLPQEGQWML